MILEKQKEAQILVEGDIQSTVKSKLDVESTDFIMQMLTKGFYSDAIGSTVRETVSNGIDSHRKANITDPVIVSLYSENGYWFYSVEDVGVGLDHTTVINVISMYGKSTKRQDANAIGCMGLGWKAPLAYNSAFYFIARKDGIERKYMQSESEEGGSDIDLLYEKETDQRNGVKVIVPLKDNWDKGEFISSIKEQLCYFQNVYFNVDGVKNDFIIYRGDDFQWSELCTDMSMHICLDDVYYPIDWSKLGISKINIPIGLKFSLTDGIIPLPNRESIRYNSISKDIILNKIRKIADYFVNKYNQDISGKQFNVYSIISHFSNAARYVDGFKNEKIQINDLIKYSSIKLENPKLDGISILSLERLVSLNRYLLKEYAIKYYYKSYSNKYTGYRSYTELQPYILDHTVYIYKDEFPKKKQNFLRDQLKGNVYFIKKVKTIPLGKLSDYSSGYDNWIKILQLKDLPKNQWRDVIKEAQYWQSLLLSKVIDLDKIEITKEWEEEKKLERQSKRVETIKNKVQAINGEIIVKRAIPLERYSQGNSCKFENEALKLNEIYKQKRPYVFCVQNDENEQIIQKWYKPLVNKVTFLIISKREYKKVEDYKNYNWIKLEDFITCKHKILRRIGTYVLLNQFSDHYHDLHNSYSKFENISKNIKNRLDNINNYISKHKNYNIDVNHPIVKTVEENNLFDSKIYSDYVYLKQVFEKYPHFNILFSGIRWINPEHINLIRDLSKYYKFRVDYVKKEELQTEEED